VNALADKGVQGGRRRGDERFALAGGHFRERAIVENNARGQLNIVGP
jgi:hypothetical protein